MYLLHIVRGLRNLDRQGIALQGEDNFIQLIVILGAKD